MITSEDLLTTRLKMVERLKHNFPWLGRQVKGRGLKSLSSNRTDELTESLPEKPSLTRLVEKPASTESLSGDEQIEISEYRRTIAGQPGNTALLGICEDGLPLTLDLSNPAPGSILVAGDRQAGKTRLLRSILCSVADINEPSQVCYQIITPNIHEYSDLAEPSHCLSLLSPRDAKLAGLIDALYAESDKRRSTPGGRVQLIVIEELHNLVMSLESSLLPKLLRLIKHGPRLGIWTLASLPTWEVEVADPNFLEAFRTHLLGHLSDPVMATYLARDDACPAEQLEKGRQFCASVAGEWLRFRICEPK